MVEAQRRTGGFLPQRPLNPSSPDPTLEEVLDTDEDDEQELIFNLMEISVPKLPGTLPQSAHTVASRRISLQFTPMAPTLGLGKEQDKEEELGWQQENTSHMTSKRLERSDSGGGIDADM